MSMQTCMAYQVFETLHNNIIKYKNGGSCTIHYCTTRCNHAWFTYRDLKQPNHGHCKVLGLYTKVRGYIPTHIEIVDSSQGVARLFIQDVLLVTKINSGSHFMVLHPIQLLLV